MAYLILLIHNMQLLQQNVLTTHCLADTTLQVAHAWHTYQWNGIARSTDDEEPG
jgi:hypothetical protein